MAVVLKLVVTVVVCKIAGVALIAEGGCFETVEGKKKGLVNYCCRRKWG